LDFLARGRSSGEYCVLKMTVFVKVLLLLKYGPRIERGFEMFLPRQFSGSLKRCGPIAGQWNLRCPETCALSQRSNGCRFVGFPLLRDTRPFPCAVEGFIIQAELTA